MAVRCQRFFCHGPHAYYFEVRGEALQDEREDGPLSEAQLPSLADTVLQDLAAREEAQRRGDEWLHDLPSAKEPSPWLQLTRWPAYLQGHLSRAMPLC